MGSFVDQITGPGSIPTSTPSAPITKIDTVFDKTLGSSVSGEGYVDDALSQLDAAITTITNAISEFEPHFSKEGGWPNNDFTDYLRKAFPASPDTDIALNENWPSTVIADPNLVSVGADFSYTTPVAPECDDDGFNHTTEQFAPSFGLIAIVNTALADGGTGLNSLVYDTIIARDREARRTQEDRARRTVRDTVGATGFCLPGGMANAASLELEQDILAKNVDSVNSVTLKDFELAQANDQFIKKLAVDYEQIQRGDHNSREDRLFNIAKTGKEFLYAYCDQKMKGYLAEWEGVKIKMETAKSIIESQTSQNKGEVDVFVGRAEVLKAQISAISEENTSKTEVVKARVDAYGTETSAVASENDSMTRREANDTDRARLLITQILEQEGLKLKSHESVQQLAERSQEAIGGFMTQIVASALSMISTSLTYGYHGGETVSAGATVSNSLSEGHSFEEKS